MGWHAPAQLGVALLSQVPRRHPPASLPLSTAPADTVAERSNTVSTKLQARQDKMEELHRVQLLLKKLQASRRGALAHSRRM